MTMTIEQTIEHLEDMASSGVGSSKNAEQNRMIAVWLTEYKKILEMPSCNDCGRTNCGIRHKDEKRYNCYKWERKER